jgi:fructosamine-3-kinase
VDPVVKQRGNAPDRFFEAEAAGLAWLSQAEARGGVRTARVIAVGQGRIALERIRSSRADAEAAVSFGKALARTHDAGAAAFGAPPDGWSGPLYIGRLPQPSAHERTWGAFYARDRVEVFLEPARRAGNLSARDVDTVLEACAVVASGAFDDDDPPARLHGDLWNGNVLWSPTGAVLIDPAAHGGHRETDLAMLDLFGCPHLDLVRDAYQAEHPLVPGWRERIPVHQLHPLAVHAVGHGPAYGVALVDAARRTLALA